MEGREKVFFAGRVENRNENIGDGGGEGGPGGLGGEEGVDLPEVSGTGIVDSFVVCEDA